MHVPSFRLCPIDHPHQGTRRCLSLCQRRTHHVMTNATIGKIATTSPSRSMSGRIQCPRRELALRPSILFYVHSAARDVGESGTRGVAIRVCTTWTHYRAFDWVLFFVGGACGWNEGRGQSWQYFNSTNFGQSVQLVLDRGQNEGTFSPFHTHRHLGDPQADQ